jgi:hypothetical protein
MSPAERVLAVPELAELILLYATIIDVWRCSRVNKTLSGTIETSKAIRRKLFLEADNTCGQIVNPLTPAFFKRVPGMRTGTIVAEVDIAKLWNTTLEDVPHSWQDVYISQPPPTTSLIASGDDITYHCRRVYPDGMTFGDLSKAIIAAHDIRKGSQSRPERLRRLTYYNNPVLIYWR